MRVLCEKKVPPENIHNYTYLRAVMFCLFFFVAVFETIPQAVLQFLLLWHVFGSSSGVTELDVYLSIISATLNCIFQILRLRLESQACNETFDQYCLECLMARISWIPFEKQILRFLGGTTTTHSTASTTTSISISTSTDIDMTF